MSYCLKVYLSSLGKARVFLYLLLWLQRKDFFYAQWYFLCLGKQLTTFITASGILFIF